MSTIQITISGDKETVKTLQNISKDFQNCSEPLLTSSKKYLNVIFTNFKNHGMTFNELWPELSDITIQIKKDLIKRGKAISLAPLIRTGLMQKKFGYDLIGTNVAQVYNEMEYAKIHQEGGTVLFKGKRRIVPMRILADVDDERIEMVSQTFVDWINGLISKYKAD